MIEKSTVSLSMGGLLKKVTKNEVRFDLAIQRNEVWDASRKSLFIHSLLAGFPFPPVYAHDKGDSIHWMLDGKQRMSSVVQYLRDTFALSNDTPPVIEKDTDGNIVSTTEVAGKKFSDLSDDFQGRVKEADFLVYKLKNMDDALRDEMFLRLNNGMPLTKMELTRVIASSHVMSFVNSMSDTHFFSKVVPLSDAARNRFVDDELVLQILSITMAGEAVDIDGVSLKRFAQSLRHNEIPANVQEVITATTEYLGNAIPNAEKALKKVHVPIIFIMAQKAMNMENPIPPEKFGGWMQSFFSRLKENRYPSLIKYAYAAKQGSAKKDSVSTRIKIMTEDFEKNIFDAPNYEAPVIAPVVSTNPGTGRRRGRPRKNVDEQKNQNVA